ncbi:MAG: cysteine synthase family protein [Candidatus Diapherotrites archaeon]|jgi:S-sulfo-L-cysteine synthase (O-acetyl-L-serine-dependent)|uniref:Cysteine synthase family protein n=1 Tax=Candidatus Iainarchaeum sp. TaxID=3101447 RepID=A0A8T5GFT6_9ARCH|nr:cysteine synthase family protein [Candidatus Diapherotrites archaeon]
MSARVSKERRKIIRAFGAKLILTNKNEGTDRAIKKVAQLVKKHPKKYINLDQYSNNNNWLAHYKTTGPEILKQTNNKITHLVAGLGTSGTIIGISKFLKEKNPKIKIIATHQASKNNIQGLKNMDESIVPKIYDTTKIDKIIDVTETQANVKTRKLSKQGFFVGISSGAAMFVAEKIASKNKNATIVVIFPDGGEKYLSSKIF